MTKEKSLRKENPKNIKFKRGQVYIADLGDDVVGSEQGGERPVLILQNNIGNKFSPNLIVLPLTTKNPKRLLPTHVPIKKSDYNMLTKDSIILTDQWRTISKERITKSIPMTMIKQQDMKRVEESIKISVGLEE